jgi:hypothetical protein
MAPVMETRMAMGISSEMVGSNTFLFESVKLIVLL